MGTNTQHPPTASTATSSPTSPSNDSKAWIHKVKKMVDEVGPEHQSLGPCTIFEIPKHIRDIDSKDYMPVVVRIGPFHHDPSREPAMQEHKRRCVRYLLSCHHDKNQSNLLEKCLLALKDLDEDVRNCYSKKFSELDPQDMAEIMLLDGCFIIHLLLEHADKEREEEKKRRADPLRCTAEDPRSKKRGEMVLDVHEKKELWEIMGKEKRKDEQEIKGPFEAGLFTVKVLLYDLLKLENQIPFFVIQTLYDLLRIPKDSNISLPQCALDLFCNIQPSESELFNISMCKGPIHHLLHLFHSSRILPRQKQQGTTSGREWIPSVTELRWVGVKFRKNKQKETNFLDIRFDKGRMEIPPLRVTDHTCSLFRNLIAFEQCYKDAMTYVTTYAIFMDCLIDEAKDAQLLHLKGILVNRLSTEKALAGLFNKLCNQIHYSPDNNYLADLFVEVHRYYNSRGQRWKSILRRDYLTNPWTIISVIAAIFLLLLTIEQAVFAFLPYVRPPKGS